MRSRHRQIVVAVLRKDFSEALRDARVVIPLLVPLGLGLGYSFAYSNGPVLPKASVVFVTRTPSAVPATMLRLTSGVLQVGRHDAATAAAARGQVASGDADLAVVIPAGFDAALRAGRHPRLVLLLPRPPTTAARTLAAAADRAVSVVSQQPPPATIRVDRVTVQSGSTTAAIDLLGLRPYTILLVILLLLVMVGVSVTPTILSDEVQSHTLDALLLAASYLDVIVAKAVFGLVTSLVGVPILLVLTRLRPADPAGFGLVMLLSALVLVGLGLLLGSYMRTQGQLSVWSNLAFFPLTGAMILATIDLPAPAGAILTVLPTVPMTRLAGNALAGRPVFPYAALSWVSLVVWVGLAFGGLWWRMSRIEA